MSLKSTTTPKPVKVDRHLRLVHHPKPGKPGRLLIFEGKKTIHIDDYLLIELEADWGKIAFRFEKTATTRPNASIEEPYNVLLDGERSECDCKGHSRWQHCKHVEAIQMLIASGKLKTKEQREQRDADEAMLEILEAEWCQAHDVY